MSRAWEKEKILSPYEESNLRSLDSHSNALPLSLRDSTVSEVYYKIHMTHMLTARISFVNSIMFVNGVREMVSFELGKEIEKDLFCLFTSVGQRKNSEFL